MFLKVVVNNSSSWNVGATASTGGGVRSEPIMTPTPTPMLGQYGGYGGGLGSIGMMTKDGPLGSPNAPIHMVTAEGGLKVQAWRTLRTLALGFLLLSGVGALIEDRGISKGISALCIR